MKTVVDAVNMFGCDLSDLYSDLSELLGFAECLVSYQDHGEPAVSVGYIRPIYREYSPSMLRIICTVEEFNQCVAEMSKAKWIPEKVSKPTYTKAMQEEGERPPIGVRVMIDSNGIKLEGYRVHGGVVCIGSKRCGFTSDDCLGDAIYSPILTEREKQCEISVKNAENILVAEGVIKYDPLMLEILFYKGLLK